MQIPYFLLSNSYDLELVKAKLLPKDIIISEGVQFFCLGDDTVSHHISNDSPHHFSDFSFIL